MSKKQTSASVHSLKWYRICTSGKNRMNLIISGKETGKSPGLVIIHESKRKYDRKSKVSKTE